MAISVFDLFKVGIGPSSSHTVGPMNAARTFVSGLADDEQLAAVHRIHVELFGSLGLTGRGHGSDRAILLGLEGEEPATVDIATMQSRVEAIRSTGRLSLLSRQPIHFDVEQDLVLHRRQSLPTHPNGMTFAAFDETDTQLRSRTYFSVGGGFIVDEAASGADRVVLDETPLTHPFSSAAELLAICATTGLPMSGVVMQNELAWRNETEVRTGLLSLWSVMQESVRAGANTYGILPGGLHVKRRAADLHRRLLEEHDSIDPLNAMDWVNLFALAVNEENAAGGRIVTAPTNGAAGIVPAVLHYYMRFVPNADDDGVVRFLLTAGAIGMLFKQNASISGAEVGCQGEVGSASAMAAAGLCEVLGGTPRQVENAAEIGLEHNLGLTCDPVGGLVQIPCIERNAMGSVKAINAARIALRGDGSHIVSLDMAVKTMRETGADMKAKYKETSRGGLAVNVIEC